MLGSAGAGAGAGVLGAPCTTITAALLSPRCMQVAISMEKLPGTCFAGGGANELELRRSLWLEAGSVRQRRRAKTGPAAAPCTTITAALLSPRYMQVAVSMEKPSWTCFAGGGANGLELRRSLWLERAAVAAGENWADSSPLHLRKGCSALTPLHAGCRKHGEAARDLFCWRRRQWA